MGEIGRLPHNELQDRSAACISFRYKIPDKCQEQLYDKKSCQNTLFLWSKKKFQNNIRKAAMLPLVPPKLKYSVGLNVLEKGSHDTDDKLCQW